MKKISEVLLIVSIFLSPVLFGMTEMWSKSVVFMLISMSFLFIIFSRKKSSFYNVPGLYLFMLVIFYFVIQIIPMPPGMLKSVAPGVWEKYNLSVYLMDPNVWMPISGEVRASLFNIINYIACFGVYVLTVYHFSNYEKLEKVILYLSFFAGIYGMISILQYLIPNDYVFWFIRKWPEKGSFFGTYVNRNHYAGLMEMLFPLVLVYFFKIKPKVQYESLKERIVDFFSQPSLNMYFLIGFFALVSGSSVFFSLSRGGIISFLMSLILISFLLSFKWGNKKKIYFVGMVSIILFLFVGLVGWDPIFDRFDMVTDEIQKGRSKIWADSFIMFKDSPIFGFGLGGFNAVYPAYQRVFPGLLVDHAHNDYIELLTEGGIIGFILVAIFMVYLIFFSFKKWYKRNNRNSYYLFVGAFVGILGILFHSFTDFNLQIGANRLILFFIIGIMVSAAVCNSRHTKDVQLNSMSLKKHKIVGYFLTFSTLFYSSMNLSAYIAKVFTDPFSEVDISKKSEDIINIQKEYLSKATLLDFFNGDYHYYLGSANAVLRDNENAVKAYKRSIRFSPYNGENLQYIALALENGKEIDITNKFLSNALKLDISNKSVYQNYTSWLFARGFADKGSDVVKNYLSLFPTNTPEMITLMVIYGFDKNFIIKSMPEDVFSYLSLGDYLMNFGENDLAEVYYTKSLELNKTAQIQLRTPYYKLYGIYNNKKQYENALFLMQEAVNNFPDDPYLRSYLGLMYEKNGIIYKAIEEYRIALMINPKISWVKNRLNNLIPIN